MKALEELLIHLEGRYYFFKAILKVMVTDHLSPNYNDLRYLWHGYLIDWLESLSGDTFLFLKFIYSEKATKFCEISTVDLTVQNILKTNRRWWFRKNFVFFSQNPDFKYKIKMQPQNWIQYSQWGFFFCKISNRCTNGIAFLINGHLN